MSDDLLFQQSIKALEGVEWEEPDFDSYVVRTGHAVRKKPLCDLTDEELRLALSQEVGLPYVVMLAAHRLAKDPYRSGDFYDGDVMVACLGLRSEFWRAHPDLQERIAGLAKEAVSRTVRKKDKKAAQQDIRSALARFCVNQPAPGDTQ